MGEFQTFNEMLNAVLTPDEVVDFLRQWKKDDRRSRRLPTSSWKLKNHYFYIARRSKEAVKEDITGAWFLFEFRHEPMVLREYFREFPLGQSLHILKLLKKLIRHPAWLLALENRPTTENVARLHDQIVAEMERTAIRRGQLGGQEYFRGKTPFCIVSREYW